jgi:hypothetical protein
MVGVGEEKEEEEPRSTTHFQEPLFYFPFYLIFLLDYFIYVYLTWHLRRILVRDCGKSPPPPKRNSEILIFEKK